MGSKAWIAVSSRLAASLCAFVIIAGTAVFVWQATLSVVVADAWSFTATFLARYYDGTLAFSDFFVKRNSLDHAQPVQKLLLIGYARFFDLDFAVEAMTGVLFGVCFVALIAAIVRIDVRGRLYARMITDLTLLGCAAIVFSLNEIGVFNWSLVTLSLFYPFGVVLLLAFAYGRILRQQALLLAIGIIVACTVLDTSGILTAAVIVALIALRQRHTPLMSAHLRLAAAIAAATSGYMVVYGFVFPGLPPDILLHDRIGQLAAQAGDLWKVLIVPFGAVVISPSWIVRTHGAGALWIWLIPSAIALWVGHVWFWREFLRRRDEQLGFVAAGLMLYYYATIAGIVWGRAPRFGFDYLMQSRYLVFYELQLIAILMMAASKAARIEKPSFMHLAFGGGVALFAAVALRLLYSVQTLVPYEIAFNRNLAREIVELANDPTRVPADCSIAHLTPCDWPLPARIAVLDLLRSRHLNVFSPRFRAAHNLPPLSEDAARTPPSALPGR